MLAQQPSAHVPGNPDQGRIWDAAMRAGDFAAAWAVSDAVLAARDPAGRDDPARPYHERWVWDGRPFDGRRVLVRCYHGLGDTIQFARFLPALGSRAAHVTVEAQPELLPLLRTVAGIAPLHPFDLHPFDPGRPLPPAEVDLEIMELCHALRLPPGAAGPFLHAEPLGPTGTGVCWEAGGWNPARSIPPMLLGPLLGPLLGALPGPRVSLQRGPGAAAGVALGAADPLDGSPDVSETARLIAGLDAVVTVDTMVAHLAGALGRPTVVLLKHDPDWRWGEGGACAWYSSVRTARQPAPGDWAGAVAAACALLPEMAGTLVAGTLVAGALATGTLATGTLAAGKGL